MKVVPTGVVTVAFRPVPHALSLLQAPLGHQTAVSQDRPFPRPPPTKNRKLQDYFFPPGSLDREEFTLFLFSRSTDYYASTTNGRRPSKNVFPAASVKKVRARNTRRACDLVICLRASERC